MASNVSLDDVIDLLAERIAERLRSNQPSESKAPHRLLSISQAGAYLNRSASSVRHLINTGKLPQVRLDGRVFLDIRDLDEAIERAKQSG